MNIQNVIYSERLFLEEEKKELETQAESIKSQIELLDLQIKQLQDECQHNIILMLDDHLPHKIGRIVINICPACAKEEHTYRGNERKDTCFKNSTIIDLTKYHIEDFKMNIPKICEYIYENSDIFYSNQFSTIELAKLIIEFLERDKKEENTGKKKAREKAQ